MTIQEKHLHIISFNIPYPADYGGVIDVFYKIKALAECGVEIHLHCFEYGREQTSELNKYCVEVNYYKREKSLAKYFSLTPFIVNTRESKTLLTRLKQDDYPILCEGIHTSSILKHYDLTNRQIFVRAHNIEHEYYQYLAKFEKRFLKKCFFYPEAFKLRLFEKNYKQATEIAAISINDYNYFQQKYGKTIYIPAFQPYNTITSKEGNGSYALYQADLSIAENQQIAIFLIDKVFSRVNVPLVIAGKNPPNSLIQHVTINKNISIIANPLQNEMDNLLENAQLNILYALQGSGIKLKLLAALFKGRHCIANNIMVDNTGLSELCHIANNPDEMVKTIKYLFSQSFSEAEIKTRENTLLKEFSNQKNAEKLINFIFQ